MKTSVKKGKSKSSVDGVGLAVAELKTGIKKAEKGPFYTSEESKEIIAKWRSEKNSR